MGKKNPFVFTIGFDKSDPDHVYVTELLNTTEKKAKLIVAAILAYTGRTDETGNGSISMCISPAFLCPAKCTDSIHYILSHSLIHPQRFFFHQINFCGHFSIYLRNVLPFQYLSYFFPDDLLHHWPEHIRFHAYTAITCLIRSSRM